jgi:hypothetical protein
MEDSDMKPLELIGNVLGGSFFIFGLIALVLYIGNSMGAAS